MGCQYFANVVICKTLKPNRFNKLREKIEHLKCICVYCGLAIYIDFVLYSAKSSGKKNNWKCDSKELFIESFLSILCVIIQGKVPQKRVSFLIFQVHTYNKTNSTVPLMKTIHTGLQCNNTSLWLYYATLVSNKKNKSNANTNAGSRPLLAPLNLHLLIKNVLCF